MSRCLEWNVRLRASVSGPTWGSGISRARSMIPRTRVTSPGLKNRVMTRRGSGRSFKGSRVTLTAMGEPGFGAKGAGGGPSHGPLEVGVEPLRTDGRPSGLLPTGPRVRSPVHLIDLPVADLR